ncbi:transporter [Terriglobus saanensis]|uniref:Transporter n=1 Tax=Terriglobus saanensis (strain ATCC BAA-1853 / DSM 23119 / SP1PR4) TaxID=401053 RepID=E8V6C2_TERSS|nr:transporter [Terriglobus saanensis]ADV81587.1 hypothetical protein AciPR4_0754 [Terriglobus saanensis SP1PR4]
MSLIRAMSVLCVACFGLMFSPDAFATEMDDNEGFFAGFERRATATQSKQPGWAVPLFAPHSGLIQSIRQDFTRQIGTTGTETWNYGGGKGVNFIPLPNTQVDINFPPYFQRSSGTVDGAGDFSFGVKYRLATAKEKKGNYSVMVGIAAAVPTGSYSNGATHTVISPNVAVGKGWGRFDVQSSALINLPTGNTGRLGRHVTWHTLAQVHLGKYFWPEIENSTTFYQGGTNDGRVQNHILPGLMFGKIKFKPEDPKSRTGISVGAGMQFATTHFHVHDHMPIFSARFTF